MITLFAAPGASDFWLSAPDPDDPDDAWPAARTGAIQLLRARGHHRAGEILEATAFERRWATNLNLDGPFPILYRRVPASEFVAYERDAGSGRDTMAYREIAAALETAGAWVRIIAVDLDVADGMEAVPSPAGLVGHAGVEAALADAQRLIESRGVPSAVDRVHTAFHAFLRQECTSASISVPADAGVTALFAALRRHHSAFAAPGPRAGDVDKIWRGLASVIDALDPLRNRASMAHPTPELLADAEAILVVNSIRTLLHYLVARFRAPA